MLILGIFSTFNFTNRTLSSGYWLNAIALISWGIGYLLASSKLLPNWSLDPEHEPQKIRLIIAISFEIIGIVSFIFYIIRMLE